MMRAMQADETTSPNSFLRYIGNHSTPLNVNGANSANRTGNRRVKKRKLVASSSDIIDLTPKKQKVASSMINDSDIEIIEPDPPDFIDLVADDTDNCNALATVNASADVATVSNQEEKGNSNNSENNVINISVDSHESIKTGTTSETAKVVETNMPRIETVPLYIKDASGGGSLRPPLYDIVSDDSFCFDSPTVTPVSSQDLSQTLVNNVDDSVIFVSETINLPKRFPRPEDFISINNRGFNKFLKNTRNSPGGRVAKRKSPKNGFILNRSPKNGPNQIPNQKPEKAVTSKATGIKRMVLIDGNNVAFGHSHTKGFSVEGIQICLNYFIEKGYDAKAIVPQMRLKRSKSSNQELLTKLQEEGKVILSPCKTLPNGKSVTSYDDRFILDFAADYDAAVISNDNYRDLSKESEKYRDIINTRVVGFTFLNDIIRFPQDPYGKAGPFLDDILNGKRSS